MTDTAIRVRRADSFLLRLYGLVLTPRLASDEGLWIVPCNSVHTCFMRYAIDAVFLDDALRILDIKEGLLPWRAAWVPHAHSVFECLAGMARPHGFNVGRSADHILFAHSTDERS